MKNPLSEKRIISRLALIEKHLNGFRARFYDYPEYYDFDYNCCPDYDLIFLEREASSMLKFVGLYEYFPVIKIAETGENTGGRIKLDHSKQVYIDINKKILDNKERVLAVLAHEICHKLLYVNGLYYPDNEIENEYLADLATIYVGFGKISLNGCYKEHTTSSIIEGSETRHVNKIGYLTLHQFAKAYNIVCKIYNIKGAKKDNRLNSIALNKVKTAKPRILSNFKTITDKDLKEVMRKAQEKDANLIRLVNIAEFILNKIKDDINNKQLDYESELTRPFLSGLSDRQIQAMESVEKYDNIIFTPDETVILHALDSFINKTYGQVDTWEDDINLHLLDIECPICKYKKVKGLKENKKAYLKCPNCNNYFMWNGEKISKKRSFRLANFFSFFRKK